jgi:hypothetical protein
MGGSQQWRERNDRSRLSVDEIREWVEDYVAANRAASYEDCIVALIAEGCAIPRAGTRQLWKLWDEARQDIYGRRVRD